MALAILGQSLALLVLVLCVHGMVAGAREGLRERRRAMAGDGPVDGPDDAPPTAPGAASTAIGRAALATLAMCVLLWFALLVGRFELSYVADRTSSDLQWGYRLTSFWAGQAGSLLLWLAVLLGLGWAMDRSLRRARLSRATTAFAGAVLLANATFFAFLVAVVARPFELADRLANEGSGMTPALQNPWMAAHPPALYLGYVGIAIPFAIVAGALLSGERGDAHAPLARRWALLAWSGLALGLVLGARWAYVEIGWGGWWGWDPVENAALLPWLAMTAFLHGAMVQERRGLLRFANAALVAFAFALSILGTFLTRTGVVNSVHSFVDSPVGFWFLGFLGLALVGSVALLFARRRSLAPAGDLRSTASREAMVVVEQLLLVAFTLTVLWGVLFPMLSEVLGGQRRNVQEPWYVFFTLAFGTPIVLLLAAVPAAGWGGSDRRRAIARIAAPLAAGLLAGALAVVAGSATHPAGAAGIGLGVVVVTGALVEISRLLRVPGRSVRAVGAATWRRRRRIGGWLAHLGVGVLVIAVAGEAWIVQERATVSTGDQLQLGAYELTYDEPLRERSGGTMSTRARFTVRRGGDEVGTLESGRNFYPVSGELSNEVGIVRDTWRMADVYVVVDRLQDDGTASIEAFVNPLVPLVWVAGTLMVLGGLLAATDPGRRRRAPAPLSDAAAPRARDRDVVIG